jgi:Na+/H+-dicarboxylate symporter
MNSTHEHSDSGNASSETGGSSHLTAWIVGSIVAAILLALTLPAVAVRLELGGQIFLRLLQMVVVPLVMSSVMSGILGLGDVRRLGRPGGVAILYYLCTTVLAVATGLVVVQLISPGLGIDPELVRVAQDEGARELHTSGQVAETTDSTSMSPPSLGDIFYRLTLMMFTDNLLESMVQIDLLPLIIFSMIFAGMLTTMGHRANVIATLVSSINDALMTFILLLMRVAPLGIFCLVAARFGKAQSEGNLLELIRVQAGYMSTVLIGLGIHALITLPALYYLVLKKNPYRFIGQMSQAILTAFSTASSTATLPVTMECAETKAGISKRSAEFVLPLGATINMDGTALYEAAAAIFIAQAYSVLDPSFTLTLTQQLTIAITATLAAIGAAGIPEAGLITMLIVLNAVGLPLELIGLILPVDWLLDRFRTAVNAFGDSVGAAIVDRAFGSEPADEPIVGLVPPTVQVEGA